VRFAALLAGGTGAPLTIVSVVADAASVTPLAAGASGEALPTEAAFDEALRVAREVGADADPLVAAASSAARGLALAAEQLGAAVLVAGSQSGAPAGRLARGSTAERLLAGTAVPVVLVPARFQARGLATIGAGFVDTAEGRAAVREAHALATSAGARLRVLAAVRPHAGYPATADELRAAAEAAAEAAVSGLLGAPVDVDVSVAEPAQVLAGVSGELDLLVCGTRGYGPRPAALLGGVTRALTAQARCPVLVLAAARSG
jgi:nucleotide-binding universal stress UspA family protein